MSSIELGRLNVRLNTLEQLAQGLEMPAWKLLRIAEVGAGSAEPPHEDRRVAPYGDGTSKGRNETAARRKVAR